MELSPAKQTILEESEDRSVVIAAAASGKTALLTEKVRQILLNGVDPKKVVVITFTNMAADELRERLGGDFKPGLFVGTIHALANYYLLSSGVSTRQTLDNEQFDELFEMVQEHEYCIKPVEWLLLDEAQDSSILQFKFMFELIAPHHFFVVGDEKQAIYQWNGGNSKLMRSLVYNYNAELFDLNENYRNGRAILSFAKQIAERGGQEDTSVPMQPFDGDVIMTNFKMDYFVDKIQQINNNREIAILTRTNADLETIASILTRRGIPCTTFKQGDLTKSELRDKMLEDTVKVLTIHSAKGLEWDNVIVVGAHMGTKEEINVCYVAATRARKLLIWSKGITKQQRTVKW